MRRRLVLFGFLSALLVTATVVDDGGTGWRMWGPVAAVAQEADPAAAAPAPDAPAPDAPPPDAPAAEPAAPAAAAPIEDAPPPRRSALRWFYDALGLPYVIVFLGLSFTLVALFIMNLLSARRENVCPPALVDAFRAQLNERKYQEAYELAKADESFLGQMLSAGLEKIASGYEKAIEAMTLIGEEESMKLDHRLSYMALIGTIAPMVGLFGTVDGMIRSFSVIANSSTTPKPSELAAGISTALVTTIVGLAIAIPAMAAFNILKNRVARLVFEVSVVSEGLMSRFETPGTTAAK
ncbi:MAG: MotA/TolQ/ExbB proton channel family protein [Pirellulaceae bacterium]